MTSKLQSLAFCFILVLNSFDIKLCKANCGRRPSHARIVGGQTAAPNSWPWQLALFKWGFHMCGASLISEKWAVTAAHCLSAASKAPYHIMAGSNNINNKNTYVKVDKYFIHGNFSWLNGRNDIALLKLSTEVSLSSKISTVCLPQQGENIKANPNCWVTGWGRTNGTTGSKPTYLQQSKVPLVEHNLCSLIMGPWPGVHEPSMVCVGGAGSSACNGDSGGPLVCESGGRWVLYGAASWVSKRTCPVDKYSVYARVSAYVDWIKQTMSES